MTTRSLLCPEVCTSGFLMVLESDRDYMIRALHLAEKGRGKTVPNPMVGAVLVKGAQIVGSGYHHEVGAEHAEVAALRNAGARAAGATLYVTLEPCCHQGRTGPCTRAVIAAGVRKVVVASVDPNPIVNGRGIRQLRRAGVRVRTGLCRAEARRLNEVYFCNMERQRPFITLKTAQTIDGRIATARGESRWITGEESLALAHRLRAEVDAVVVGMGTVRADNPSLTVRHVKGRSPYRVVVSNSLRFPRRCHLLDNNADYRTIVAGGPGNLDRFLRSRRGSRIIGWSVRSDGNGLLDLHDFVRRAWDFGLRSLLVEGGSSLVTSFLRTGMIDKYVAVIAPMLLGEGISSVGNLYVRKLEGAIRFAETQLHQSGRDLVFVGYPAGER